MTDAQPRWAVEGVLSDEMLDRHRARLGRRWEAGGLLDRSAISVFARGIGDSNPLWQDAEYAAAGPFGAPVAPPGAFYRIHLGNAMHGLRGVMGYNIGTAWELLAPVYEGDAIRASIAFDEIEEREESRFAARSIVEHYRGEWTNQRGEAVARSHVRNLRVERSSTRRKGRDAKLEVPHPWSDGERRALEEATAREPRQIRGREPFWWEDAAEDAELEPLVKGPLRMWDMMCWFSARGILDGFSRSAARILATPALGMLHPASNAREPIEIVHTDNEAARTAGLPGAYDLGAARQSCQLQSLTHALGDDAWVKRNACEYRRFVYLGDALTFRNRIARRFVDGDGERCIEVEGAALNQRGENVMPSRSVIALPSRAEPDTPARRRARVR